MSDEFGKIHKKLDRMVDRMSNIETSQARTEENLKEHMRRSAANEENLDLLRKEFTPIKAHVQFINNISKFVAIVAAVLYFLDHFDILQKIISLFF